MHMTFQNLLAACTVTLLFPLATNAGVVKSASGKANCDPQAIAKMPPPKQKRMQLICANQAKHKQQDAEMAEKRKAWYDQHAKGHPAMEQVVAANGGRNPAKEEKLGSTIVWTYRSKSNQKLLAECKEYVFEAQGDKLKSRRAYLCE